MPLLAGSPLSVELGSGGVRVTGAGRAPGTHADGELLPWGLDHILGICPQHPATGLDHRRAWDMKRVELSNWVGTIP